MKQELAPLIGASINGFGQEMGWYEKMVRVTWPIGTREKKEVGLKEVVQET